MNKNSYLFKIISIFSLIFFSFSSPAWNHDVTIGYGTYRDLNHSEDTNAGGFISADIIPIKKLNWLMITLNGAIGSWYSSRPNNNYLFTSALSLAFRFYPIPSALNIHPYLLASGGPAYLSNRHFGQNAQGANVAFQIVLGPGIEFGKDNRFDLNVKFVHYSNADLIKPNHGFNFMYVVSVGYLF